MPFCWKQQGKHLPVSGLQNSQDVGLRYVPCAALRLLTFGYAELRWPAHFGASSREATERQGQFVKYFWRRWTLWMNPTRKKARAWVGDPRTSERDGPHSLIGEYCHTRPCSQSSTRRTNLKFSRSGDAVEQVHKGYTYKGSCNNHLSRDVSSPSASSSSFLEVGASTWLC